MKRVYVKCMCAETYFSFAGKNALKSWASVVDCGDVPLTFLDNNYALAQLTKAHKVNIYI